MVAQNWMGKSPTECRVGGRTGRKCLVLCDGKINVTIKGKVYRTVVRPALIYGTIIYGAETWALKKAQENKLEVTEMRMLRWDCGVTKLDKIGNERIRVTTKVGEITKKVQEFEEIRFSSGMGM